MKIPQNIQVAQNHQQRPEVSNITLVLQKLAKALKEFGIETEIAQKFNCVKSNALIALGDYPLSIADTSCYATKKDRSHLYFEMPEKPEIRTDIEGTVKFYDFEDNRNFYKKLSDEIKAQQAAEAQKKTEEELWETAEEAVELELEEKDFPFYYGHTNVCLSILLTSLKVNEVNYSIEFINSQRMTGGAQIDTLLIKFNSVSVECELFAADFGYDDSITIVINGDPESKQKISVYEADVYGALKNLVNSLING